MREALDNRSVGADLVDYQTSAAMVQILNSKEAHWLHLLMLDINIAEYGASRKHYDE